MPAPDDEPGTPARKARRRQPRIPCDVCVHGVVRARAPSQAGWGDRCPLCRGKQAVSVRGLATLLHEPPATIRRLVQGARPMRAETAYRILEKLSYLIDGPKQRRLLPG